MIKAFCTSALMDAVLLSENCTYNQINEQKEGNGLPFEVQKSQILSATLYAASIMTTGEELIQF